MTSSPFEAEFDNRPQALPIFIASDRSLSMEGEPIRTLNDMLELFRIGFINHPAVGDIARLALVSFSDTATLDVPLADIVELKAMPILTADGNTAYGVAFDLLASVIPSAVRALGAKGYKVLRPTIFLLTDGCPNDNAESRRDAYRRLVDPENRWTPNIAVFGLGTADQQVCRNVAHGRGKAFFPLNGMDVAESLKRIIPEIIVSVIRSVDAAAAGEPVPDLIPKKIEGMASFEPLDEVEA